MKAIIIIPSNVYLFAISRNMARVHGYGYKTESQNLAISNWPQFARNRFEIGPADRVIRKMFEALKRQENDTVSVKPLPIKVNISERIMNFEDLWSAIED